MFFFLVVCKWFCAQSVSILMVRCSESAKLSRSFVYWERRERKSKAIEREKKEGKWGMTLKFISSDALAPGGLLHYTLMGQMQLSLLSRHFFFSPCLPPTPSTSPFLSLMLISDTSVCYFQIWNGFCLTSVCCSCGLCGFWPESWAVLWVCAYRSVSYIKYHFCFLSEVAIICDTYLLTLTFL